MPEQTKWGKRGTSCGLYLPISSWYMWLICTENKDDILWSLWQKLFFCHFILPFIYKYSPFFSYCGVLAVVKTYKSEKGQN